MTIWTPVEIQEYTTEPAQNPHLVDFYVQRRLIKTDPERRMSALEEDMQLLMIDEGVLDGIVAQDGRAAGLKELETWWVKHYI